jgi:ligand-binding sensor domain-containing protein
MNMFRQNTDPNHTSAWKVRIPVWIIACCLLPAFSAFSQPYNFIPYSLPEGLPQSQVYAAFQDSKGYLWFGTQGGGVSRFDGNTFETFGVGEGVPSNFISAVFEDSRHRIWVGSSQGFAWFDGKQFRAISGMEGSNLPANAFWEDSAHHLWVGTARGVYLFDFEQNKLKKYNFGNVLDEVGIYTFFPSGNFLWVGSHRGAWRCDIAQRNIISPVGLPGNPVYAFTKTGAGRLWVGCFGDGIYQIDEQSKQASPIRRNPDMERVLCLYTASDGEVWAGTQNAGITIINPADSSYTHITETDGLPHNHVRAITRDHSGNLWIATSGSGVARVSGQAFRCFDRNDGLLGTRIYALLEDHTGKIWLSESQTGLQTLDSTGFQPVLRDSGYLHGIKCRTLAEDHFGNIWAGTEGKGVVVIGLTGRQIRTRANGGGHSDWIQKIICDSKGDVWVASSSDGIARYSPRDSQNFSVKLYGTRDGLPESAISTMQADKQGNIWFGTFNGKIGCLINGKVEIICGPEAGLPVGPVTALAFDEAGNCWAGYRGDGVYVAAKPGSTKGEPQFKALNGTRRLSSKIIYLLLPDRFGNMWAGTENGVDKLVPDRATLQLADVQHFGKNEGFLGIETCQDAAMTDRWGNMWFGTMNGLTKYVPTNRKFERAAPLLHFKGISLFYKPLENTQFASFANLAEGGLRDGMELPWNQNHLSFTFKGIDLANPKQVRYRWKLDGADAEWSPLTNQDQVNYANLAPGHYRFIVQATSDDMQFSEPISASFTILKPFWQHWQFQALVLALFVGLISWFALRYVRKVRLDEQARRTQLEVQNRMLQLEQKALQLQMNPHFIFNALNSIQSLISTRDYDTARQEINGFAKLMRSILTNSRRQTIALQEEIDTLEQYLRVEQFCQQNAFLFDIKVAEGIDPEEVELPPMLLQPFVENAVIHGVSHLQYPGKIDIRFELVNDLLICTIRDNGIGREKAALLRQARKPGHQSTALTVTKERLEAMRGTASYIALEINDVKGETSGTEVVVRLPAALRY